MRFVCILNPNPLKMGYNSALQKLALLYKEGWEVNKIKNFNQLLLLFAQCDIIIILSNFN
jgi:hypothetical protein